MSKVTTKQAEFVLHEVAKWLGQHGLGQATCKQGRDLTHGVFHADDNTVCEHFKIGPAPTGPDAAYRGIGPELKMEWDYPSEPTPTVILESGYAPEEWAIACCHEVQKALDAKKMPVMVEPYFSFALSIYKA